MIKPQKNQFINLCQDLMFKIFFSRNEKLLLSLAQTFIFQPRGKTIEKLKIKNKAEGQDWIKETRMALQNPALYSKFYGGKGVVLDILATLNTGESVNIELQATSHPYFRERILYYWSEIYGAEFKSGEDYSTLKPAYSLVFVNFPLFQDSQELLHSFSIRSDKPPHFVLTEHLGMIFVDLSRFQVPEGDFKDMLDMMSAWCYFIKGSPYLTKEGLKVLFRKSEVFKMAESALKDLSVDSSVRVLEKLREKWIGDQVTYFKYATEKGRAEGMEKGMEKGRAEGRQEGRAEGIEKGIQKRDKEIVLNMLKKQADIAFISEVTGLSVEKIEKLKTASEHFKKS